MMPRYYHEQIPGWFDFADVYTRAIHRVPDGGTLVEVGCWMGKSLSYLLVEAANSGKRLRIVGVDHFRGSVGQETMFAAAGLRDIGEVCRKNCERAGYPFELIKLPSVEAAGLFEDRSIDCCFIEGSHDQATV